MAIEYDFDPEDDLIEEGDRSLDFRYQTKAVVRACMNRGGVTGKRDYAGGVVGLMDLGRVSACENYGDIASTDGGYVGGIAGASWGTIRDSWVKCHLSGGDYIGRRGRTGSHPGKLPYAGGNRRGLRLSGRRGGRCGRRCRRIRQHLYQ